MKLTAKLSLVNTITDTITGARETPRCAIFSGMSDSAVDSQKIARRLRAVMADLDLETVSEFANFLHAERSQVSNWLQGYNMPPARWMDILCRKRPGLTLDWIFRGVADAMPMALAIKLEALAQGLDVPLTATRSPSEPFPREECQEASQPACPKAGRGKRAT